MLRTDPHSCVRFGPVRGQAVAMNSINFQAANKFRAYTHAHRSTAAAAAHTHFKLASDKWRQVFYPFDCWPSQILALHLLPTRVSSYSNWAPKSYPEQPSGEPQTHSRTHVNRRPPHTAFSHLDLHARIASAGRRGTGAVTAMSSPCAPSLADQLVGQQQIWLLLTWYTIVAITSPCGWFIARNSFMTFVNISFGGTKSRIIWHSTCP